MIYGGGKKASLARLFLGFSPVSNVELAPRGKAPIAWKQSGTIGSDRLGIVSPRDRLHDGYCRQQVVVRRVRSYGGDTHCGEPDYLCRRIRGLHADAPRRVGRADRGGDNAYPGRKNLPFGRDVDAHRCMEENKAGGKIVVLT